MTIRLQRFAIAAIIVLFLLIPLSGGFEDWAPPMDEGSLLVYPELILKGQLPYRNFETFYGPANLFILSGAYAIFGPSVSVERSVGLLYRLLILVAVFGLTKRWGSIIAGRCMILTGFLLVSTGIAALGIRRTRRSLWMAAILA